LSNGNASVAGQQKKRNIIPSVHPTSQIITHLSGRTYKSGHAILLPAFKVPGISARIPGKISPNIVFVISFTGKPPLNLIIIGFFFFVGDY